MKRSSMQSSTAHTSSPFNRGDRVAFEWRTGTILIPVDDVEICVVQMDYGNIIVVLASRLVRAALLTN